MKERFYDTERMILANSDMISRYPAQLYYSALPLLPSDTYVARQYPTLRGCISVVSGRENSWPPLLFTLPEGEAAAFTPGGHMVAVVSHGEIQIYNASNGLLNSSISTDIGLPHSAVFTEDGSEVVVVSEEHTPVFLRLRASYRIAKFNFVKQTGQNWQTTPRDDRYPLALSEYGSYIAFPEHQDSRICIRKIDGSDYISIPFSCDGEVQDLDLAGEPVHLVAVATEHCITILSMPSGAVQRTLYQEHPSRVSISRDGSFLVSRPFSSVSTSWSITQGTLLATIEARSAVFSRTNCLYVAGLFDGDGKIYDMSADPNNVTIKSLPLPLPLNVYPPTPILPTPDESRILIHTGDNIQVWSLRQSADARDAPRRDTMGIDFSRDASLLALDTFTGIEIWDARIGRRRKVIQSGSRGAGYRPLAFSPKGELIVSGSNDGIIVVDVRAGELLPMTYSPPPIKEVRYFVIDVGISFDLSKIAALYGNAFATTQRYLCVWDLPSGTLIHSLQCDRVDEIQWSWRDQYLLLKPWRGNPRYLNADTFQEEVLEHPGDRFQDPNLWVDEAALRIRLSGGSEDPLFLALPFLRVKRFASRGDRACIISMDGELLLDASDLEAYMEICNLQPEVSHMEVC